MRCAPAVFHCETSPRGLHGECVWVLFHGKQRRDRPVCPIRGPQHAINQRAPSSAHHKDAPAALKGSTWRYGPAWSWLCPLRLLRAPSTASWYFAYFAVSCSKTRYVCEDRRSVKGYADRCAQRPIVPAAARAARPHTRARPCARSRPLARCAPCVGCTLDSRRRQERRCRRGAQSRAFSSMCRPFKGEALRRGRRPGVAGRAQAKRETFGGWG